MSEFLSTWWREIADRPDGPLAFRFYLQPIMAMMLAVRDGWKDAHAGRPAFLWSLFTEPAHRADSLRSGWKGVGRVFALALVLDVVYQVVVLKGPRPLQGLLMAVVLAMVPYVLLRGLVTRIAGRVRGHGHPHEPAV